MCTWPRAQTLARLESERQRNQELEESRHVTQACPDPCMLLNASLCTTYIYIILLMCTHNALSRALEPRATTCRRQRPLPELRQPPKRDDPLNHFALLDTLGQVRHARTSHPHAY